MKTLLNVTLSTLLLLLFSCGNNDQPNEKANQSSDSESLLTEEQNTGNKIDFDKTIVLKSIYVVDRNGTDIKQEANKNSENLGTYMFGTQLEVIEETDEWFGVRDRIKREFLRNGSKIEVTGWEKVYVLKSHTGSIDEIKLVPSDLNIISSLTINQKKEEFETEKELNDFLKIDLIDKQLFETKRSSSVDFLLADTTVVRKKNGIIELKCQNKVVKFIDKPDAETEMQIFNYVGQFEFLNKYLIGSSYWEGADFKLIDKTSGEETNTLVDYPYFSPDKKYIICINTNPYEATADLELYTISDKLIKHKMSTSFKNWMPTVDPGEMFWSNDNYLYLTVNHTSSFWKEDGNLNDKCQYIRIKIL